MIDKTNWPDWLKKAEISDDAVIKIIGGVVHFMRGTWYGGEWRGGVWRDGEWRGGVWYGGVWRGGEWRGGVWFGGLWFGGVWRGGEWRGGVWFGGKRTCQSKYIPVIDGAGNVSIGCAKKSIKEWDAWFAGTEEYQTKRGTESFKLIEAHYKALRAWAIHMGIADGGGQ